MRPNAAATTQDRPPSIRSLDGITREEARDFLEDFEGDELAASVAIARERCRLAGAEAEPDATEVHHALFLLRRARGLPAPSFDRMRVELLRMQAIAA